ncbi:hypothetical protein [Sphingomonas profundi]|uniref:hypothetical protein n=1 Tax=Alterirhizorhabdus profundi TaxID=2681549 RepID=UPI0012E97F78|nr:hypothetical protein [Sphingomonas profundi]
MTPIIASGAVLLTACPASAIVAIPTEAALAYRQCVERVGDRDPIVRAELVEAVSFQRAHGYGTYFDGRWKAIFEQRVIPKCGHAPKVRCDGECTLPDERHSAFIATDDVQSGDRVIKLRDAWVWRVASTEAR